MASMSWCVPETTFAKYGMIGKRFFYNVVHTSEEEADAKRHEAN
jgi:hypothetical protein